MSFSMRFRSRASTQKSSPKIFKRWRNSYEWRRWVSHERTLIFGSSLGLSQYIMYHDISRYIPINWTKWSYTQFDISTKKVEKEFRPTVYFIPQSIKILGPFSRVRHVLYLFPVAVIYIYIYLLYIYIETLYIIYNPLSSLNSYALLPSHRRLALLLQQVQLFEVCWVSIHRLTVSITKSLVQRWVTDSWGHNKHQHNLDSTSKHRKFNQQTSSHNQQAWGFICVIYNM